MKTPEWFSPGAYGFMAGAVFVAVVGFSWGGWMTGSSANKLATALAQSEVTAALVPVCLERALSDPDRAAKLDTISKAATYKRPEAVMAAGWATVPGATEPDQALAAACIPGLDLAPT
jgi:dienelactone hydrolase